MKMILLATGVAALALSAGSTLAATHHAKGGATIAGPKQPIPYAELSAYLKAPPAQRARKDWWSGQTLAANKAETGASASTSAAASTPSGEATSAASTSASSTSSTDSPPTAPAPPANSPAPGDTTPPK